MSHKILLEKLENYGIRENVLACLNNYLLDCIQCVLLNKRVKSDKKTNRIFNTTRQCTGAITDFVADK